MLTIREMLPWDAEAVGNARCTSRFESPGYSPRQSHSAANWCLSLCSKIPVIARPVRTLVVAIPRLEGKAAEKHHEEWVLLRFLVEIVTWFHSTGGLPRRFAPRNDSIHLVR